MEKIKTKKSCVVSFAVVVGWALLNQVMGDAFPFSDLPMYAYLPNYAEYYFITDSAGVVKKEKFRGLKKIFISSLRDQGEFVFEKLSPARVLKEGPLLLKDRFERTHAGRLEHLKEGLISRAEECAAARTLQHLQHKDYTPHLHRVLIRIENGHVLRERKAIPSEGCNV